MDKNKRTSLKLATGLGLAAGAIPDSWIKPAISTAILPTHANTSLFCEISDIVSINEVSVFEGRLSFEIENTSSEGFPFEATLFIEGDQTTIEDSIGGETQSGFSNQFDSFTENDGRVIITFDGPDCTLSAETSECDVCDT